VKPGTIRAQSPKRFMRISTKRWAQSSDAKRRTLLDPRPSFIAVGSTEFIAVGSSNTKTVQF
jgi:hypothetical protein